MAQSESSSVPPSAAQAEAANEYAIGKVKSLSFDQNAPWFPELPEGAQMSYCESAKYRMWVIFEEPESSKTAFLINVYVIFLILSSAVVTVLETVPGVHRRDKEMWMGLEIFYVTMFTVELLLRICCCPNLNEFFCNTMNWIDFVSVAPFYIEQALLDSNVDLRMLRILRLGRALRLVKLARYSTGMQMIGATMAASLETLQLTGVLLAGVILVCACAIYYCERGDYREDSNEYVTWYRTSPISKEEEMSPFQSIPESVWWVLVTLTTVGYGDVFPVTYTGQLVGLITQLLGVLTLALPLSIIGANFHEVRQAQHEQADNEGNGDESKKKSSEKSPLDAWDDVAEVMDEVDEMSRIVAPLCKAVDMLGLLVEMSPSSNISGCSTGKLPDTEVILPEGVVSEKDILVSDSSNERALSVDELKSRGDIYGLDSGHFDLIEGFVDDALTRTESLRYKMG